MHCILCGVCSAHLHSCTLQSALPYAGRCFRSDEPEGEVCNPPQQQDCQVPLLGFIGHVSLMRSTHTVHTPQPQENPRLGLMEQRRRKAGPTRAKRKHGIEKGRRADLGSRSSHAYNRRTPHEVKGIAKCKAHVLR